MSIVKSSYNLLLANIATTFQGLLVVVYLNKYFSFNEVGMFFFTLSVSAPIFLFLNFDLRRVITLESKYNSAYFLARIILNSMAFLLSIILVSIFLNADYATLVIVILIVANKFIENISEFNFGLFQTVGMERKIFISRAVRLGSFLVLSSVGVSFGLGLPYFMLIILLSSIIAYILIERRVLYVYKFLPHRQGFTWFDFTKVCSENYTLGVSSSMVSLTTNLPVYFIEYALGSTFVGIFSSLRYIVLGFNVLTSSIGYALLKRMENIKKSGYLLYRLMCRVERAVFGLGFIFLFLIYIIQDYIILLYNDSYQSYGQVLLLLFLGGVFMTMTSYQNHFILTIGRKSYLMKLKLYIFLLLIVLLTVNMLFFNMSLQNIAVLLIISTLLETLYNRLYLTKALYKQGVI